MYNFHDELRKTKENPNYILPEDINASVIEYLRKIGCEPGSEKVKEFQDHIRYGRIRLIHDDRPDDSIKVQIDCGMADGYEEREIERVGKWTMVTTFSVKNKNLTKKKPGGFNESKSNGNNRSNGKACK